MLDFKEISLDQKSMANDYLSKSGYMGCEYNFVNLFIWRNRRKTFLAEKEGFLFIKSEFRNYFYYLLPAGEGDFEKALNNLIEYSKGTGDSIKISGITDRTKAMVEGIFPHKFVFTQKRDWADYVYNAQDLITLKGSKYHSKRNHINKFEKTNGKDCYEDITQDNISECMDTYLRWYKEQEGENLEDEYSAVTEALGNFNELGLRGGLLRVKGDVCAFTAASKINDEVIDIHIEKGLSKCPGSYAVINRDFAKNKCMDIKYINREEDMGIAGLRKAKLSYKPAIILTKYIATLKD